MTTAIKLSPAQIKALNEINEHGVTNARKNTFDSIEKYTERTTDGLRPLKLNADGREALGLDDYDGIDDVELKNTVTEQYAEWEKELLVDDTEEFDRIIEKNNLMGQWRNSEVWADLSLDEVREDIKTAKPINRKARRLHTRLLASEYRRVFCPRPRKALKLTGAKGM